MHMFDNGWFRITGLSQSGKKSAHYFFNDEPLHVIKNGLFKEEPDFNKRYSHNGRKCKLCETIIHAYRFIGLDNRLK